MTQAVPDATSLVDALHTLRAEGRHALDPVRFGYLESLAQRLPAQHGAVQAHLCTALHTALADYQQRCAQAPARSGTAHPMRRATLRRAGLDGLKALNLSMRAQPPGAAHASGGSAPQGLGEMKSVQQFKQAWGRMQVQDQVGHALTQGPANAGPLNSHQLVLRTLGLMQGLSPDYLHHFIGHLDTLLRLDSLAVPQTAKPVKAAKSAKPVMRKTAAKK